MESKEEIFAELKFILTDVFEIDENEVTPDASLYDDLDIDSIDAVDLIIQLQEKTGKKIEAEEFHSVRTVQDVVDVIETMLKQ